MKYFNIIITTIVVTLFTQVSFGQWVPAQKINSKDYVAVSKLNNNTVFVGGSIGNGSNERGVVYKSTDGGTTFNSINVNSNIIAIYSIYAKSVNEIYVGEGRTNNGGGKSYGVWKTTNGGSNWTKIINNDYERGYVSIIRFSNLNPNFGVIISDPEKDKLGNFRIHKTTDGGLNWTKIEAPDQKSNLFLNSGFVVDENFFGFGLKDKSGFMMTTNGGNVWRYVDLSQYGSGSITSVSFNNNKLNGIVTFSNTSNTVLRTTNGGTNWFEQTVSPSNNMVSGDALVKYISGTDALYMIVTNNNTSTSYKSIDNGLNWETVPVPTQIKSITQFDLYYNGTDNLTAFAGTSATQPIKLVDPSPLPVKLQSFTYSVSGRNVTLNWSTTMEENNEGFEVERKNENGTFTKIGFVKGHGNSNNVNNYKFVDTKLESGKFSYRIKQIDYNGNYEYFTLSGEVTVSNPSKFSLSQNYPNPFNPVTKIDFEIPQDSKVTMKVYDLTGKEISTIFEGTKSAGFHTVQFDGSKISTGVYFYRLITNSNGQELVITKKMNLIK